MTLSKSLNLIGRIKGKFSKQYSKMFFLEVIERMQLKLGIQAYGNALCLSYFSIINVQMLSLIWQLKVSIDL